MFNNIPDFYPTPDRIIDRMLCGIKFNEINTILEPSAGKGDIVKKVIDKLVYAHSSYNRDIKWDIDTIEIDDNLQHILRGKKYRVVYNDFLSYQTFKNYDLIIANPPFSQGDKHLLKMIELQQYGGKIICLLNAETIKNPCTVTRKDLISKLDKYNASIEFISNAFVEGERHTLVEVALIKLDIPRADQYSVILEDLKKHEMYRVESSWNNETLISGDYLKGIVEQYEFEVKAGIKLMSEWSALNAVAFKGISIWLDVNRDKNDNETVGIHNLFIKNVRAKYWKALFESDKFMGLFTSNLKREYLNKVKELCDYDFSLYNIYTIKVQLNQHMIKSMEDTILSLFEEFSNKYHWHPETGNNIHYYNGWATNKAWKINKKVIIVLDGYYDLQYSWGGFRPTRSHVVDKMTDIEKVLNYLDGGMTQDINIMESLLLAEKSNVSKKIQLKYFTVTFYKKGTCHIEFTNDMLLHKFNVYGSQRKGWLPPVYGKAKYKDMTPEEKAVINDFEGEASYNKVICNKDYYIVESSNLLMLA